MSAISIYAVVVKTSSAKFKPEVTCAKMATILKYVLNQSTEFQDLDAIDVKQPKSARKGSSTADNAHMICAKIAFDLDLRSKRLQL